MRDGGERAEPQLHGQAAVHEASVRARVARWLPPTDLEWVAQRVRRGGDAGAPVDPVAGPLGSSPNAASRRRTVRVTVGLVARVSTSRSARTTSASRSGRVSGAGSAITPAAIRCSTYGVAQ